MKLENQLVCRGLSEELEKNGYPQEGLWWWHYNDACGKDDIAKGYYGDWRLEEIGDEGDFVAPTIAELGKALPSFIIEKLNNEYQINGYGKNNEGCFMIGKSLCNIMAKMWLYLKKKGLIK